MKGEIKNDPIYSMTTYQDPYMKGKVIWDERYKDSGMAYQMKRTVNFKDMQEAFMEADEKDKEAMREYLKRYDSDYKGN